MSRYAMCPICGHRMRKIDEETYYCEYCANSRDDDDDIPECCVGCNPAYPECRDSCPMFDD